MGESVTQKSRHSTLCNFFQRWEFESTRISPLNNEVSESSHKTENEDYQLTTICNCTRLHVLEPNHIGFDYIFTAFQRSLDDNYLCWWKLFSSMKSYHFNGFIYFIDFSHITYFDDLVSASNECSKFSSRLKCKLHTLNIRWSCRNTMPI